MVSIFSAYRDLVRLREIYVVLVRHGFGELASRLGLGRKRAAARALLPAGSEAPPSSRSPAMLSERGEALEAPAEAQAQGEQERSHISPAERIRLVAQDLGPSFVKLGQIASTRSDVLPAELLSELKKLQDAVAPFAFDEVRRQVEASLARTLEEVYESFDERPLAAASIGQVHRAVLRTAEGSREVVVKVQRPGVAQTVARDLELLHALAAVVERTIPESQLYSPRQLVANFDRAITAELDYGVEAEHARRFAKNFEGRGEVKFPRVYAEASGRQVLTLEFLPGRKVDDALAAGYSGPALAKVAVGVLIKMIFEDGFFHADPHPGNILIMGEPERPVFGLVDLGMVGRLSADLRDKTVDLMLAAVREDALAVADALYAIGTPTRKVDMRAYRADVSLLAEKYLGRQLKDIQLSSLLRDLVQGATKYGIEIPPDFLMVGKALMTLEGIGREIDPELDVFGEARPYFVDLLKKRYSPERILNEAWRGLDRLSSVASDLPQQAREILDDLRLGRLQMKTSDPALYPAIDRLGRRVFSGVVTAAFLLGGSGLLASHAAPPALGYGLLSGGAVVLLLHMARDLWRR
ncbi:MAG: AarF/ABC1/UbiB kinase family protein [Polyangiaceae bacterium]|jgi:ubiquinone biosynthesis protein|nr:AarF/ABC1/UbiB kinase family protein [Polyangiaceae bacterium]